MLEVQGLSESEVTMGNSVTIGRNVKIRPSSYYGIGHIGAGMRIGNNSSIGPEGYIGCAGFVDIGNDVMIGPNVTMIAENHNFRDGSHTIKSQGVNQRGITIENNVWIGANVMILDGVTIHEGAIIGATTLVNKDVPENAIYFNKRQVFIKHLDLSQVFRHDYVEFLTD
ncbi:acyltransferase [Lactiplantibacillus plantarum]|uniref:acyltransferase n=1 Tax=Lactiplantibacillus plantarum TaxID=1590 RepID=UPI003267CBE5